MKKPERVKQRFAKTVHIVSAMTLGLLAHGLFHWLGGPAWDSWTNWPINILVGVYCMAILFSKTPVPLSRAANEDMQEYKAWCRAMMKQVFSEACQRWRQSSVNSKYGYCLGISVWKFRSTLSFICLSGGSGPPSPGGLSGLFVSRTASLKGLTALF
jgi:hypothetical protein